VSPWSSASRAGTCAIGIRGRLARSRSWRARSGAAATGSRDSPLCAKVAPPAPRCSIARCARTASTEHTRLTVLSDGDAGLRALQRAAVPRADPVLDWFHIAMRWQHVHQLARGAMRHGENADTRTWLLTRLERAKWAPWHGQFGKTRRHLSDLLDWTWTARGDLSWLQRVNRHLSELLAYLNANADALPNYGARYRAGAPIVAKRMIKRQQMRWNRDTVQRFLTVRAAVLNGTLRAGLPVRHVGFRPSHLPLSPARREHPTQLHPLQGDRRDLFVAPFRLGSLFNYYYRPAV